MAIRAIAFLTFTYKFKSHREITCSVFMRHTHQISKQQRQIKETFAIFNDFLSYRQCELAANIIIKQVYRSCGIMESDAEQKTRIHFHNWPSCIGFAFFTLSLSLCLILLLLWFFSPIFCLLEFKRLQLFYYSKEQTHILCRTNKWESYYESNVFCIWFSFGFV